MSKECKGRIETTPSDASAARYAVDLFCETHGRVAGPVWFCLPFQAEGVRQWAAGEWFKHVKPEPVVDWQI